MDLLVDASYFQFGMVLLDPPQAKSVGSDTPLHPTKPTIIHHPPNHVGSSVFLLGTSTVVTPTYVIPTCLSEAMLNQLWQH